MLETVGIELPQSATAPWAALSPVILPSSGRDQDKHPLQVPGHGHEVPLTPDMIEPAQQELAEAEHGLDDTETRIRGFRATKGL